MPRNIFFTVADPSRYQSRTITRGPRKGQSVYYDTVGKRFMPSGWTPQPRQSKAPPQPKQSKQPKQPKQPKKPKQAKAPPVKVAKPVTPQPKAPPPTIQPKPPTVQPAPVSKPAAQPSGVPPQKQPATPTPPMLSPQAQVQMQRIQAAAKQDLTNTDSPMVKYKNQLAIANFGSGDVRTIRSTKDAPLSVSDHETMDRLHSRTAMALTLVGDKQGAAAQLEAAQYHRSVAQWKGQLAQKAQVQPPTPKQIPVAPTPSAKPVWKNDRIVRKYDEKQHQDLLNEQASLRSSMSGDEVKAFLVYSSGAYEAINTIARGGKRPPDSELGEWKKGQWDKAPDAIKKLDAVFERTSDLKQPVYTHRGISVTPEVEKAMMAGFERAAKSGQTVGFGGYMSTSIDPNIAHQFSEGEGDERSSSIGFEIKAKKGVYMSYNENEWGMRPDDALSYAGHERELLLPRNAKYKVAGIKEVPFEGGKRRIVQLEQQ